VYSPQDSATAAKDKLHDVYLNVQKHKNNFSKKAPDRTAEAGKNFFFLLEVYYGDRVLNKIILKQPSLCVSLY
jgi:hypothetical protein